MSTGLVVRVPVDVSDSDHKRRRCEQSDGGLHSFSLKDWCWMIPWVVRPMPLGCTVFLISK